MVELFAAAAAAADGRHRLFGSTIWFLRTKSQREDFARLYLDAALRIEIFSSITSRTALSRSSFRSPGLCRGRFKGGDRVVVVGVDVVAPTVVVDILENDSVFTIISPLLLTAVTVGTAVGVSVNGRLSSDGIAEVSMDTTVD